MNEGCITHSMLSNNLHSIFADLGITAQDAVIVGSSVLYHHTNLRVPSDIDVVLTQQAWLKIAPKLSDFPVKINRKTGRLNIKTTLLGPCQRPIDFFSPPTGLGLNEHLSNPFNNTTTTAGLQIATIEQVLAYKELMGREKDKADLRALII